MGRPFAGGHVRTLGGKTQYRLIWVDGKQRLEHRIVMESMLGRPLETHEIVHHRDGNGLNNEPANLELLQSQAIHRVEHSGPFKWDMEVALEMRANGSTIRAVAKHFGVNEASVNMAFRRRGISTSTPRKLKFDRETAATLFRKGITISEIARRLGVAPPSIRKALAAASLI